MNDLPKHIQQCFGKAIAILPPEQELNQVFKPKPVFSTGSMVLPHTAPSLLALHGYPQSGKDVVAEYVCEKYSGAVRFAFSDFLVEYVNTKLFEFNKQVRPENKNTVECRTLLQQVGIYLREIDPHVLTHPVANCIKELKTQGADFIIVTGMRDLAEYQVMRELNGETWRVYRPGNPYKADAAIEAALDLVPDTGFEAVLYNDVEDDLAKYQDLIHTVLIDQKRHGLPNIPRNYHTSRI